MNVSLNKMKNYLKRQKIGIGIVVIVSAIGFVVAPFAAADTTQSEIDRLRAENVANNAKVESLASEAKNYEDAIKKLSASISALQGKIDENVRQQKRLNGEIEVAEKELAKQRDLLGQNIRSMYLEGDISTLEMLASSKNISEFVDKEQYRSSVQSKIKSTLEKIQALRLTLKSQKEAVDQLLKEQAIQRQQLASSAAEQRSLLSYNQEQREAFNRKTAANSDRIKELIAAQQRANFNPDGGYYFLRFNGVARDFSPGAYPYKNAGFGMSPGPGCVDNDGPDEWGYCTRQCVSYAAWAVEASGRQAPRYYGNAKDWVAAAYARPGDVAVYRTPKAGDVAISTSGYWGHAMYVESVDEGSRTFVTSEYNTHLTGQLSYQNRSY